MLKILPNTIGVYRHSDKTDYDQHTQSNIVPAVFHTIILPLGLSIGSIPAGLTYFILVMIAYSTIFRYKNHYVVAILKTAGAMIAVLAGWILLMGFVASIGAIS